MRKYETYSILLTEAVQVVAIFFKIADNLLRKSPRLSHGECFRLQPDAVSGDFGRTLFSVQCAD